MSRVTMGHYGALTIAFDDKSSYFYLFLLFTVHSFSDTVGLIYPQAVVAPNAPDAREGNWVATLRDIRWSHKVVPPKLSIYPKP